MWNNPIELFRRLFASTRQGALPYSWQERVVEYVVEHGTWPDIIDAPTGAGKTSLIDAHVFANAYAGWLSLTGKPSVAQAVPRRLALVVPRRALVDDQYDISSRIRSTLENAQEPSLVAIREGLAARAGMPDDEVLAGEVALSVASLRGELSPLQKRASREWQTKPTHCAVLHFTPDMFGSALLFRRYGASANMRPVEAGLLAFDTVAVFDEAHLSQQLTLTASRVAPLEAKSSQRIGLAPLRVVRTTATPGTAEASTRVGVRADDLNRDSELRRRIRATKRVEISPSSHSCDSPAGAKMIVAALLELYDEQLSLHPSERRAVGCVLNTVSAVLRVSADLRSALAARDETQAGVLTIVGRMRPFDRTRMSEKQFPGALTPEGNSNVQFIIATQTLEVGVDLDFSGMVTELASPSALAQRAGRVNRQGKSSSSRIIVLDSGSEHRSIYSQGELDAARSWLSKLGSDFSPLAVSELPPPLPEMKRPLLQRLERWDVDFLAATREHLQAEQGAGAGIELWTREGFDESIDVGIVVRQLPANDVAASQILKLAPTYAAEEFPASISTARQALEAHLEHADPTTARFFRFSPETNSYEVFRRSPDQTLPVPLRPGDQIVVDDSAQLFLEGVVHPEGRDQADDVLSEVSEELGAPTCVLYLDHDAESYGPQAQSFLKALWAGDSSLEVDLGEEASLGELFLAVFGEDFVRELGLDPAWFADPQLMIDVVDTTTSDSPSWAVVIRVPGTAVSEELREVRSGKSRRVLLDDHQKAVGERAASFAQSVGIPVELVDAVRLAGQFHDEGKRDPRFQSLLRRGAAVAPDAPPLAKSGVASWGGELRFRAMTGLTRWRHEQLSAAYAWDALPEHPLQRLIVRLAGTSHGYGRKTFDADVSVLIPEGARLIDSPLNGAQRLYDVGLWEWVIDDTHDEFGVWGCAYLEALLRAADMTVSAEGN